MSTNLFGKALKLAVISIISFTAMNVSAQTIELPLPVQTGGMPLSEAIANRHSTREFDASKDVSPQLLSNLLWSAAGINRPESGMRSNPTALNTQEVDVYVFNTSGVYLYDPKSNHLIKKADGDHRSLVAGTKDFSQEFVLDAPISLVMVADISKFERKNPGFSIAGALDSGIVSENINLFCSANGLATVPRLFQRESYHTPTSSSDCSRKDGHPLIFQCFPHMVYIDFSLRYPI